MKTIHFFLLLSQGLFAGAVETGPESAPQTASKPAEENLQTLGSFERENFMSRAAGEKNSWSALLKIRRKTGETNMSKALREGDINAFSRAVQEGLKSPARRFLEDWLTVTEEGDTALHLLAKIPGREAARAVWEITQAIDFPKEDKAPPKLLLLRGYRIFTPLERTAVYRAAFHTDPKVFEREWENLLSGPAMDLLMVLHAVTSSKKTLQGVLKESEKEGKALEDRLLTINTLKGLFHEPWKRGNKQEKLPVDIAGEAKNQKMYYVLRGFAGDPREKNTDALMALGGAGIWGAEALSIWKPGNEDVLYRLADKWGVDILWLIDMTVVVPVLLSVGGVVCHHVFKSKRQKRIIKQLEKRRVSGKAL